MKFLSRLLSVTVIGFNDGCCVEIKGKIDRSRLNGITDLLTEAGLSHGEIWIHGDGRIEFSRQIKRHFHQRLRNILLH